MKEEEYRKIMKRIYACQVNGPMVHIRNIENILQEYTRHEESVCLICKGTGNIAYEPEKTGRWIRCHKCHGTGRVKSRLEEIEEEEK